MGKTFFGTVIQRNSVDWLFFESFHIKKFDPNFHWVTTEQNEFVHFQT